MAYLTNEEKFSFEARAKLNAVSESFCLAKWLQVTMHLHRGLTHSCHHPLAHEIPLSELSEDAAALHNTEKKIAARAQMMKGERPKECQFCWSVEDLGHYSDRTLKSQDVWAMPYMNQVLADPLSKKIAPKYLEVSFSRACNFKCSYCAPAYSSKWAQEIMEHGAYKGREHEAEPALLRELYTAEDNPYTKAFWQWWPELKKSLHTFRITGGEPLLSADTFKVLEMLQQDPAPGLALSINSNLGVSEEKIDRFIRAAKDLLQNKKIARFDLFTSLEAWGKRAEYIRFGLDMSLFERNLEKILSEIPQIKITVMSTFNALSLTSYKEFLAKALVLREKYSNQYYDIRFYIDISHLRNPEYQAANVLTPEFYSQMEDLISFVAANRFDKNQNVWGFSFFEQHKLERIFDWMKTSASNKSQIAARARFYEFFSEHDRRRGTDFLRTFPEMSRFWRDCERAYKNKSSIELWADDVLRKLRLYYHRMNVWSQR